MAAKTSAMTSADDEERHLWPALVSSSSAQLRVVCNDALESSQVSQRGSRSELCNDHIHSAVGKAFDRLWCDRPSLRENTEDSADFQTRCTADGYISNYFRHVAELSRESVYQAHQRDILHRMRDDLIAGDRSGNMLELDKRIQQVELDDRSLQKEINNSMRIAASSREERVGQNGIQIGPCIVCCPVDADYPPVFRAGYNSPPSCCDTAYSSYTSGIASGATSSPFEVSPVDAGTGGIAGDFGMNHGDVRFNSKAKYVPPCQQDCSLQ